MHSTLQLISFYKTFGFVPLPEDQLPKMIRERSLFCFGEMAGCNVCPMRRAVYQQTLSFLGEKSTKRSVAHFWPTAIQQHNESF